MPSKKERIESLEVDVLGLCDRVNYAEDTIRELEAKIADLEKKLGNAWLIPTTNPVTFPSTQPLNGGFAYCFACNQYYFSGVGHVCSKGNPIITWTTQSQGPK